MPKVITIDGRGDTVQGAIKEMWNRMQPLLEKDFHPVSQVEIVDESEKKIIQTFQLNDPEFQLHLKSDQQKRNQPETKIWKPAEHKPEKKGHFAYIARIQLEG